MAPYSPERRRKNQIEILGFSAAVLVAALLAYAAGWFEAGSLISTAALVLFVSSILWWLFGSKTAGDTTNTWVEKGTQLEDGPDALTGLNLAKRNRPAKQFDEAHEPD